MEQGSARRELRAAVLEREPCQPALQEEAGTELAEAIRTNVAPCAGDARGLCIERVSGSASRVEKCPEGANAADFLRAELAWAKGDHIEALTRMEKLCGGRPDPGACLRTLATRAIAAMQRDVVGRTIRHVIARECDVPARCGAAWAWAARTHAQAGDDLSALADATKATTEVPTELSYHWLRVDLAERSHNLPKVVLSLETILARSPGDVRAAALLQKAKLGR